VSTCGTRTEYRTLGRVSAPDARRAHRRSDVRLQPGVPFLGPGSRQADNSLETATGGIEELDRATVDLDEPPRDRETEA
jgi:hypothetical protein